MEIAGYLGWGVFFIVVIIMIVSFATGIIKYFEDRHERDSLVTGITVLAVSVTLATICVFPIDIWLVSSTNDTGLGIRKPWASEKHISRIRIIMESVYYTLFGLHMLFTLVLIPFAYFWYEEFDEDEPQTLLHRVFNAMKYSMICVIMALILFAIGIFLPLDPDNLGSGLEYFKNLFAQHVLEKSFSFVLGVLLLIGSVMCVFYSAPGLALLPTLLIKSTPDMSLLDANESRRALIINREKQRAIEVKYSGRHIPMSSKDRRNLESLQREERTLIRKARLAQETGNRKIKRFFVRVSAILNPFKLLIGLVLLILSITVAVSMLLTIVDKIEHSECGFNCGYVHASTVGLINVVFAKASNIFPLDLILIFVLALYNFLTTVLGLMFVGIRILWVDLFKVRPKRTLPQGLLITALITMMANLALNYSFTNVIAPQYAHYGRQVYCDHTELDGRINCIGFEDMIKPCTENSNGNARIVCVDTVISTLFNRIQYDFPFFGAASFLVQFVYLGIFTLVVIITLIRTPRLSTDRDEYDSDSENESLLAHMGRRFVSAVDDVRGHRRQVQSEPDFDDDSYE